MTREEEREAAIEYIKGYRKLDEDLHNTAPKDSISYYATDKCLKYWDMAIQALEQQPICPGYKVNCENCPAYEPCDAISRQAVLDEIDDTNRRGGFGCKLSYTRCRGHIKQLPPVTQKSGKWIYRAEDKYSCSKCGTTTRVDESGIEEKPMYKFCPYCGAKMESEVNNG